MAGATPADLTEPLTHAPSSEPPFQQEISQGSLRLESFLSNQHFKIDFRVKGK